MADIKALQSLMAKIKGTRPARGMRSGSVTVTKHVFAPNPSKPNDKVTAIRITGPNNRPFTLGVQALVGTVKPDGTEAPGLASKPLDRFIAFAKEFGVTVADRTAEQLSMIRDNLDSCLAVAAEILDEQAKTAGAPEAPNPLAGFTPEQVAAALAALKGAESKG